MIVNVVESLIGTFELAFGRIKGLRHLGASQRDVLVSFVAMAIALPAEMAQKIDNWAMLPASDPIALKLRLHALALVLVTAVVSWFGFLAISYEICRIMRRDSRWPYFVSLWNWSQVVQCALALAANLPILLGAPVEISQTVLLLFLIWAIWFDWRIVRLSLAVPVLDAILFVVVDAVVSNLVPYLGDRMGQWI